MKISEMMDNIQDSTVEFNESAQVSSDRIKEITMRKINKSKTIKHKTFKASARIVIVAAAVTVIGCGTVFAATGMFGLNVNKTGNYAGEIEMTENEATVSSFVAPSSVPEISVKLNYVPQGFEFTAAKDEESYVNADNTTGFNVSTMVLDSADKFSQNFMVNSETLDINGKESVYLAVNYTGSDDNIMQNVYMVYPDEMRIVGIFSWGGMDKGELLKVAEGLELSQKEEMISAENCDSWSKYCLAQNEILESSDMGVLRKQTVKADEMNLHNVGDSFQIKDTDDEGVNIPVEAKITDVSLSDDLDVLENKSAIPESWNEAFPDGTIGTLHKNYIKNGDGVNSKTEVVKVDETKGKLVYVTCEFTNTGDEDLTNVFFMTGLLGATEDDGEYSFYGVASEGSEYNEIRYAESPEIGFSEMYYYDVKGGERNNNYIPEIKSGETVTVHMAWIIGEEDLDKMFLEFNQYDCSGFTEAGLITGMVDLRQ